MAFIRSSHVHVLLFWGYLAILLNCAVSSPEEQFLQQLMTNYVDIKGVVEKLESKVIQLEDKVIELEIQLKENNEIKEALQSDMNQLKAKLNQQEYFATTALQNKRPSPTAGSGHTQPGKSSTPRTCLELRSTNPALSSGIHWIDPDGDGGDSPITVYCNMTTGSTAILHDSESPMDVGHCADPGCYSRVIKYNATYGQMKALADLSARCQQAIKYDCFYAPLELNNVAYGWWNDRDGNAQYFWAGNNDAGIHTCQCGISGNCVDAYAKCNCDAIASAQLVDDGVIINKELLPITRLNFGRTQLETSSGVHTLGKFECTGSVAAVMGIPTSCKDLWLLGYYLSGLYSIKGASMIETVYCDFNKLVEEEGFQKWIGYSDIKSFPTHFYVQKDVSFCTSNTPIKFEVERLNVGHAMNLTTGKFTAPVKGTYYFAFTALANFPQSTATRLYLDIFLFLNNGRIGRAQVDESNTVSGVQQHSPVILHSSLKLNVGDQVWMQIYNIASGVCLSDDASKSTHFTGWLVEEEIVASL